MGKKVVLNKQNDELGLIGHVIVFFNTIVFAYLYLTTEILSFVNAISKRNIRLIWGIFFVGLGCFVVVKRRNIKAVIDDWDSIFSDIKGYVFVAIGLILVSAVMALVIVPCNFDSMTYHLPRVMHWIQNGSVEYYFTNITRQLYSQPFAEYVVLHLFLLRGSDQCVNLVQWYAYFLIAQLILLILKRCNVKNSLAAVGTLMVLTAPIIVAESTSTQNDLFAGIWPLMYLYLAMDFVKTEKIQFDMKLMGKLAALGTIAGLAFLSKAQGVIPIAIISLWILIVRVRNKDAIWMLLLDVLVIVGLALLLALPYFSRNYEYSGDILASSYFGGLAIETADPRGILLNLYKNLSMGAKTYSNFAVNKLLYFMGLALAWVFRFPIEDPRITFPVTMFTNWDAQFNETASYHMDSATAPIISWMFIACMIFALVRRKNMDNNVGIRRVLLISILIVMAYVKWQPWVTRLLVPVYLLMVLYAVLVLDELATGVEASFVLTKVLPIILIFTAVPAIYTNGELFVKACGKDGRLACFFENKEGYWEYSDLICYVAGLEADNIGMILSSDGYEYPLWALLKNKNNKLTNVDLETKNIEEYPDCILKIECDDNQVGDTMSLNDVTYVCTYLGLNKGEYSVWELNE